MCSKRPKNAFPTTGQSHKGGLAVRFIFCSTKKKSDGIQIASSPVRFQTRARSGSDPADSHPGHFPRGKSLGCENLLFPFMQSNRRAPPPRCGFLSSPKSYTKRPRRGAQAFFFQCLPNPSKSTPPQATLRPSHHPGGARCHQVPHRAN